MSDFDDDSSVDSLDFNDFVPSQQQTNHKQNGKAKKPAGSKKLSVERIYQKKTQLEHILLRPDTYIGSVQTETKPMWVWDERAEKMTFREISFVPGLYKIFDEILVNAADNKQRDKNMNCIRVDIDPENNEITIYNNGKGIPVIEHKDENCFVPTLIFGHLLTSSNYNDEEKKVVGGRNGFGAKLCNIFSSKFKVETSCKEYRKAFSQVWTDNMKNTKDPKIVPNSGEDFTRITFQPDLSKFKMSKLDDDIVALFSRRAYDVAGSSKGVKVFLNGKKLPISGFKEYVEMFVKDKEDEIGNPIKIANEVVNDRWEIAATVSDRGFQQISFVNSIATTRGGKHVDYISDQIVNKVADIIKKKNKQGVAVKPFQIKNHLWIFVNCLIENPTFDSQTKETMTLQSKCFGSKCSPSDKFFNTVTKVGVVEAILSWVKFKAQTELSKKCHAKKHAKLTGIPKLEDANDAGTKNSVDCTLILTEGDSAKSLVVAGLGVVGRDKFGVFPLRGKILNVREASHKQILENAEINNIIKIVGLQYKKQYSSPEDLKTLRYGKIMIMTDQDQDGSHIKGLLVNFIHHNWPSLLKLNFLEQFITPIVKASKGSNEIHSFYSLPEFEEWKKSNSNWRSYKIKYYKGLGTSTSSEAKEYFSDMIRHRIKFIYAGNDDDHFVQLAFSKKMVEQRKDWLTNSMEERKRRRELGLPEMYLYEKNTRAVSYKDFVNKELILFSNMDNERSIPSLVDGLKPGQRKVLFTCFKRNDKREVKVAQLAGSVGEHSAYHHGEQSLMSTIINLAQNFVGSNNINLLQPIGQFGTRLQGGKDAASPRYIFTMLSPLARKLFSALDDPLLNYLFDDNLKIEPEYYVPIIPMVLINGAEGIGTGWSTKIPNYNPSDIVENVRRLMRGQKNLRPMRPWFKGFTGTIEQIDTQRFIINGEAAVLDSKSFEITELPVRTWTQTYKEMVLEPMLNGSDKTPAFISDYKEYHTDATVKFVITLAESNLEKALNTGLHKTFKIQSSLSTTSMVLFDHNGCMKRYETPEDILQEFYPVRLEYYVKRKAYYEGVLEAEASKLENQARFITEKNDRILVMENVKKKEFIAQLIKRNYDSDPVKAWKRKNADKDDELDDSGDSDTEDAEKKSDFDYLIDMSMRSMLREKVDELLKQRDQKKTELQKLRMSTPESLWEDDLQAFLDELAKVEELEKEQAAMGFNLVASKKSTKSARSMKPYKSALADDYKPSIDGERVIPKIDVDQMAKKTAQTAIKKSLEKEKNFDKILAPVLEKISKDSKDSDSDDSDGYIPLSQRIGISPELIDKKRTLSQPIEENNENKENGETIMPTDLFMKPQSKPKSKDGPKKKTSNGKKAKENGDGGKKSTGKKSAKSIGKQKKGRNPWSSESDAESDSASGQVPSDLDFDDDEELYVKPKPKPTTTTKPSELNSDNIEKFKPPLPPVDSAPKRLYESDDDDDLMRPPKPDERQRTSEELFDSLFTSSSVASNPFADSASQEKSTAACQEKYSTNDNTETFENKTKKPATDVHSNGDTTIITENTKQPKKKKKQIVFHDSEDDEVRKSINSSSSSDGIGSDSSDDFMAKKKPTKPKKQQEKVEKPKKPAKSRKKKALSSDTDDNDSNPTKKQKSKKTKTLQHQEETSFLDEIPPEFRTQTGRVRQPVNYRYNYSSEEDY